MGIHVSGICASWRGNCGEKEIPWAIKLKNKGKTTKNCLVFMLILPAKFYYHNRFVVVNSWNLWSNPKTNFLWLGQMLRKKSVRIPPKICRGTLAIPKSKDILPRPALSRWLRSEKQIKTFDWFRWLHLEWSSGARFWKIAGTGSTRELSWQWWSG